MIAPSTLNSAHSDGDSDSDWDDDDDFGARKINIKIKPIAQVTPSKISASVDELRATVGTWKSLANINLVKPNSRRHHQSTVQLNNIDNEKIHPNSILSPQPSTNSIITPDSMVFPTPAQNSNGLILQINGFNNNQEQKQQKRYTINLNSMSHGDDLSDPMLVTNQFAPQPTVPQNFGDYMGLDCPIFEDNTKNLDVLLKSSSSSMLSPGLFSAFKRVSTSDKAVLPVAFAVQECLNVNSQIKSDQIISCQIIGSIKMAVPLMASETYASKFEENLDITLNNNMVYDKIRLNSEFVSEMSDNTQIQTTSNPMSRRLLINMKAVQNYITKVDQKLSTARYILLPELLRYSIRSQEKTRGLSHETSPSVSLNPLQVQTHWLCDLNITKVRLDIQLLSNLVGGLSLTTDDIKNLKISMHVNGDVASYQSKPDANWNPLDAKLTWSFSNLTELVLKSTLRGVTSCLARFNLNDGPSKPGDVAIQFSIAGKAISGSYIKINNLEKFRLATQKFEVRTGTFKCQPPCF